MIHYHGTPITPRTVLLELAGRSFCVSYANNPTHVNVLHDIGQSVMLDNGAYSLWNSDRETDWSGFAAWAEPWLAYHTTWAVIPDVIDGTEEDNDLLIEQWNQHNLPGAPVWHLHESIERLKRLVYDFDRVCFGSSGQYSLPGSELWRRRCDEAFNAISLGSGRIPVWIHMLRGMDLAGSHYPFASVDSANVGRNHSSRSKTPVQMVNELDARQNPAIWHQVPELLPLEGM